MERQDAGDGAFAYEATGDSVSGFSLSGPDYSPSWLDDYEGFLDDPGAHFPAPQDHFYAVEVQWEERPDPRVSFRTGLREQRDRRIRQIAAVADASVILASDDDVQVDGEPLWSWLLQYDEGSSGRSRLSRVFRNVGYDVSGNYPDLPADGSVEWTTTDSAAILANPHELFWSDDDNLADASLPGPGDSDVYVIDHASDPFWLDESWQEGGGAFESRIQDWNGDGVPDQFQHAVDPPLFPNLEASLVDAFNPQAELLGAFDSDERFWIRHALPGEGWTGQQPGPVDPFALYGTADVGVLFDFDMSPGVESPDEALFNTPAGELWAPWLVSLEEWDQVDLLDDSTWPEPWEPDLVFPPMDPASVLPGLSKDSGTSLFCTAMGAGVMDNFPGGGASGIFNLPSPMPIVIPIASVTGPPLPTPLEVAAGWCEYQSCAPYCEGATAVTHPGNPHAHALPPAQHQPIGSPVPVIVPVELDLEVRKEALPDPEGFFDQDEVVLWEKYAVTRANAAGAPSLAIEHTNMLLGGMAVGLNAEPLTRVRHVDGYAHASFTTRLHDELVEIERNLELGKPPLPGSGMLVETVQVHDTLDMDGDGDLDRVMSGGAVLSNHLDGVSEDPLWHPELEAAFKDEVLSTELNSWIWAPFDAETGTFGEPRVWEVDYADPELMGGSPDPWGHDHFAWMSLWESTAASSVAPAGGAASVSIGPAGPTANLSASVGPTSVSFGRTGVSAGVGPVSFSPGQVSLGPVSYTFKGPNQGWNTSAGAVASFVVIKVVTAVLDGFDIPYQAGINPGPDGVMVNLPGVGGDCIDGCRESARALRHTLMDMNGDACPDLVVAGRGDVGDPDYGWRVGFSDCAGGFGPMQVWANSATDYLSLEVTDVYHSAADVDFNTQPGRRRTNVFAQVGPDINGDGLPDFVFFDADGSAQPPPVAFGSDNSPSIDPEPGAGPSAMLRVMLNNGRGFEAPQPLFPGGLPTASNAPIGHYATISSMRHYVETSELYNNGGGVEMKGLLDWNGDGLVDWYQMRAPAGPDATVEDREPEIFLNTGQAFSSVGVTIDTSALIGLQIAQDTGIGAELHRPHPRVMASKSWDTEGIERSRGPFSQSFFMDFDADGRTDWVLTPDQETVWVVPLQSDVQDQLVMVRRPGGHATTIDYDPARDFMDWDDTVVPWTPGSDWDAFPARSQVVTGLEHYDGVTEHVLGDEWFYDEPRYDVVEDLSLGWGVVERWRGGRGEVASFHTDRTRTGLKHRDEIVEGPYVLQRTDTTWSDVDFAAMYANADNWHHAPILSETRQFPPPPGQAGSPSTPAMVASEVLQQTWTSWSALDGKPSCVQDDADGDGQVDRADLISYDRDLRETGLVGATREVAVLTPPAGSMQPWECGRDEDDGGAGLAAWDPQLKQMWDRDRTGLPTLEVARDLTVLPAYVARRTEYEYAPNGRPLRVEQRSDQHAQGIASWILHDPVVGLYPLVEYSPWVMSPSGLPLDFGTTFEVCGITDGGCASGAHGLVSTTTSPQGLTLEIDYDALGRTIESWDDLATDPLDRLVFEYQRYVRGGPAADPSAPGTPGMVRRLVPIGSADAPMQREEVEFFDGFDRVLMSRTDWMAEDGVSLGQRVEGVVERDERDRVLVAWLPCFSWQLVTSPDQLDPNDPSACAVAPGWQEWQYDGLDRETVHERADGSRLERSRWLEGGVTPGIGVAETLIDASGEVLQHVESLEGPFVRLTHRFMPEIWHWMPSSGGGIPDELRFDGLSYVSTETELDAMARTVRVWRTGQSPGLDETLIEWDGFGQMLELDDPDRGIWAFEYDDLGRPTLREVVDRASGVVQSVTEYTYDRLGRTLSEVHDASFAHPAGQERWDWTWDEDLLQPGPQSKGQAVLATHQAIPWGDVVLEQDTAMSWSYDARGRPVQARQDFQPDEWGVHAGTPGLLQAELEYFADGQVWRTHMPQDVSGAYDFGGEIVEVYRHPDGQPAGLAGDEIYVAEATWEIQGRPARLVYDNGVEQTYDYATFAGGNQALQRARVDGADGGELLNRFHVWDAAGNLRSWQDQAPAWFDDLGDPHGGPESVVCRYDGLAALQECIAGEGFDSIPDDPGELEPWPEDVPIDYPPVEMGVDGEIAVIAPAGWVIDQVGVEDDISAQAESLIAIVEGWDPPKEDDPLPFPMEAAKQLVDHPDFGRIGEAMREVRKLVVFPPRERSEGTELFLQVARHVTKEMGGEFPELHHPGSPEELASLFGLEPDEFRPPEGHDGPKPQIEPATPFGDWEVQYRYDALGNLLGENVLIPGAVREGRQFYPEDRTFLAPMGGGGLAPVGAPVARAQLLMGVPDRVLNQAYDARGSLVSQSWKPWPTSPVTMRESGIDSVEAPEVTRQFEWNGAGRLSRVSLATATPDGQQVTDLVSEFWYDHQGQTLGKRYTAESGDVVEVRRFGGLLEFTDREGQQDWTLSYRLGDRLVAQRDVNWSLSTDGEPYGEELRYVAGDHLGSASIITDDLGELRRAVRYEPYGRMREQWGPDVGLAEASPGDVEELFTGKRREVGAMGLAGSPWELEAYDHGARYYLPLLGRWASADPVTPDTVWEANAFAYVRNNPLTYVDPTGHLTSRTDVTMDGAVPVAQAVVAAKVQEYQTISMMNGGRLWPTLWTFANYGFNPVWQLCIAVSLEDPITGEHIRNGSPGHRWMIFSATTELGMIGAILIDGPAGGGLLDEIPDALEDASHARIRGDLPDASPGGVRQYPDGSYRTPDGKFASVEGMRPPGARAAEEFSDFLSTNGMDVVGTEMEVVGPLGARRYDIVVRDAARRYHGIEIKSGGARLTTYQGFTDYFVNRFGAAGTGRLKDITVTSATTVYVP